MTARHDGAGATRATGIAPACVAPAGHCELQPALDATTVIAFRADTPHAAISGSSADTHARRKEAAARVNTRSRETARTAPLWGARPNEEKL